MIDILMKFLPADKRALLQLAMRMANNLDTAAERKKLVDARVADDFHDRQAGLGIEHRFFTLARDDNQLGH